MTTFDVDQVLSELTLAEKISLLAGVDFWHTYKVERLNVPSVRVSDGPNGVRGTKFSFGEPASCFPCGTGVAATFNKDLIREAGNLMAKEARAKSAHAILGPTTNIQRGPLGGRGFESFSEDPYLAGMASVAIVKGIQEKDIGAVIKHFVGNDLEDQRIASDSIITERALREIYLEPFRLAVKYEDPASFMTSYNKVNGEHASQSKKFLHDILRKEWAWDGMVMSDWFGTYTTKTAIENGLDLEMPGPSNFRLHKEIQHMITSKELNIQHVDDRVRGVLKFVKWCEKSGIPENGPEATNDTPETRAFLQKIAAEAIVLLKNEDELLPLKKSDKIAVIGPNAKIAAISGGGSASLYGISSVTPFDGITKILGKEPEYSVGCYAHKSLPSLAASKFATDPYSGKAGVSARLTLQPPSDGDKVGLALQRREIFDQKNYYQGNLVFFDYMHQAIKGKDVFYADLETYITPDETADYEFSLTVCGSGKLYVDGKLLIDNLTKQSPGSAFFGSGTVEMIESVRLNKGQRYTILVEYGSGKTSKLDQRSTVTFGGAVGVGFCKKIDPQEEIKKAVDLAKSVDKVVLSVGLNQEWETEGWDRPDMELPMLTNDLVRQVIEANPNTIVLNQSGTPVEFPWLSKAKGLVHAWYGGSECGSAIAKVLFGEENPSGKLSLSWPFKNSDNPAYLNFKTVQGRVLYGEDIYVGYRYYEKLQRQVAFPFGYGKSYTQFKLSGLSVKVNESDDKLSGSVTVENVGKLAGSETAQIYIAPKTSKVDRPIKELKGFEKVNLKAGEKKTVEFDLSLKDSTSFFDEYLGKWNMEKGQYEVQVGTSSDDIELYETFEVKKAKLWLGL